MTETYRMVTCPVAYPRPVSSSRSRTTTKNHDTRGIPYVTATLGSLSGRMVTEMGRGSATYQNSLPDCRDRSYSCTRFRRWVNEKGRGDGATNPQTRDPLVRLSSRLRV